MFLVNKETPLPVNNKYFITALFIKLTAFSLKQSFQWSKENVIFSELLTGS